jgi:hypothetical protein
MTNEKQLDFETLGTVLNKLENAKKNTNAPFNDEPFLRGVHHGYVEGLHRAIGIVLDMRAPNTEG